MAKPEDIRRYRANWDSEMTAVVLYRTLSEAQTQPQLAEVYRRLAAVEEKHAKLWESKLKDAGVIVGPWKPGLRLRVNQWVARRFGPQALLPMIAAAEKADQAIYDDQPEASGTQLPADERSHARVLGLMGAASGGVSGSALARIEGRHRSLGGNALRAAVLGANDGLVSNLSLVMGVAGAALSEHAILVTGISGLLAGAISMAIGEWVSVQSSRELNERQIALEADELLEAPAEEEEELTLIYQAKGLPEEQARALAKRLIADPSKALDALSREELGIDPNELGGSAWEAAAASFLLFALGALVPVSPFFFFKRSTGVALSLAASALGLFLIGAAITLVTGRSALRSGVRQLLFGLAAAGVTFGIGRLIGVNLGG